MDLCRSKGRSFTGCQSWRSKKNSADQPCAGNPGSNRANRQNFSLTSNFDSPYLCCPLTYRDLQYLFGSWLHCLHCFCLRDWHYFKDGFSPLKMTPFIRVYLVSVCRIILLIACIMLKLKDILRSM